MQLYTLLVLGIVCYAARATMISDRHTLHLVVNEPDDPAFSLENLSASYAAHLANFVNGTAIPADRKNPFLNEPDCTNIGKFRTIDGTCNNPNMPFEGAAKTPLQRLIPATYQDGFNSVRSKYFKTDGPLPSPRTISTTMHPTTSVPSSTHSHHVMNFGSFMDHDMTLSPQSEGEGGAPAPKARCCEIDPPFLGADKDCFPITFDKPEVVFTRDCIPFLRSAPAPGLPDKPNFQRFQLNDLTSFIDASNVYGSTNTRAKTLREFKGGRLLVGVAPNGDIVMPMATNNPASCTDDALEECRFASGDVRNSELAASSALHIIMLKEHNRIVKELAESDSSDSSGSDSSSSESSSDSRLDDETLYLTARKIVGAILQRITYGEFLPEVLGEEIMNKFSLTLETGSTRVDPTPNEVDPSIVTEFSTAAFRFGHTLIRSKFSILDSDTNTSIPITDVFSAVRTVFKFGSDGLLNGLTKDASETRDRFMTAGIRDTLFDLELDLMAFNLQRSRDHGVGSYNDIRRKFGLTAFESYDDFGATHPADVIESLQLLYPSPEDIEIFPGGVTESKTDDRIIGETMAHILGEQFARLKFGDNFWHETSDEVLGFTGAQLRALRSTTLSTLLCEHQNDDPIGMRKNLFKSELADNPTVPCSVIPKLRLTPWKREP